MSSRVIAEKVAENMKNNANFGGGLEYRDHVTEVRIETRGDGKRQIVGHASVFDQWTTLYDGKYWSFREVVRPGAFANALREGQDVRALFNHDSNFILGRTRSGTLTLSEDQIGLMSRADPPDTQTIRDLVLSPIERRDITGMSFGFRLRKQGDVTQTQSPDGTTTIVDGAQKVTVRYEGDKMIEERELINLDIFDVSPVVYPAYDGTDVAMRSIPDFRGMIAAKDVPHVRETPITVPAFSLSSYLCWLDAIDASI